MVRFSHFSKFILVKVFNRRERIRLASPPFVFGNILKPTNHAFGRLGRTLASCFITVGFDFPNCVLFQERRERPPSSFLVKATPYPVGTHGSCVRCVKARRVTLCRDAPLVSSQRASVPVKATPYPVGTHGSCVRCIKGYSILVLTGTATSFDGTPIASTTPIHSGG